MATVESDKRTVLQVDARKVADSATTGKSGEKEKIAKLKMELERLSSIGTANERGSVVSEVAHLPFQMGGVTEGQGAGDQSLLDGVLLQAQNTAERIKSFNRSGLQIDIMSDSINLFAAILFGMGALCLLVYTVRRRYKEVTGDSGAEGRRGKRRRARQRSRSHQILI